MRKKLLAIAALAMFSSMAANAVPVKYDVAYTASVGGNGVGSFFFDNAIGVISDFGWNFGGTTGGIVNGTLGTSNVFGDTIGRFMFEILSRTDVHSGANCVSSGCSISGPVSVGSGPLGASGFGFSSAAANTPAQYSFNSGARGSVSIRQSVAVPEPTTISLLAAALLAFGFVARRRSVKAKI